jgi:hypothetical protein
MTPEQLTPMFEFVCIAWGIRGLWKLSRLIWKSIVREEVAVEIVKSALCSTQWQRRPKLKMTAATLARTAPVEAAAPAHLWTRVTSLVGPRLPTV